VRQGQPRGLADVVDADFISAVPGGQRDRGPGRDQVGPHAVHPEPAADRADLAQGRVRQDHVWQPVPGHGHGLGQRAGVGVEAAGEPGRVGFEGQAAPHHLGPLVRVPAGRHLHGQPEPVQQLRPQLAFLRVHRADEQEAGRVPDRHALALHVADAERGRVQQQVDQVVVQQVDLVHVEQPAVGGGQHTRLVGGDPLGQGPLDVQRPGQPVFGRADRQLGQGGRAGPLGGAGRVRAVRAARVGVGRVAGEPAARHHPDRRQQGTQPAHDRGLGGALLAPDQHPADRGRDRVEQQGQLEVGHADDGRERVERRVPGTCGSRGGAGSGLPLVARGHVAGRHVQRPFRVSRPWGSTGGRSLLAPGSALALAFPPPARQWHNRRVAHRLQLRDSPGFAPEFLRVPPAPSMTHLARSKMLRAGADTLTWRI
jgi:hypothetical protein